MAEVEACGLAPQICEYPHAFRSMLRQKAPEALLFTVVTEEGADEETGSAIRTAHGGAPSWSMLPAIFLIGDTDRPPPACRDLFLAESSPAILMLERPVKPVILRRAFRMSADHRQRQYATRDLLAQVARDEERQRFLLRELRHRTANSLAILQSIFALTAEHARDLPSLVSSFTRRMENFAAAHIALSNEETGNRALSSLIRDHVEPLCLTPDQLVLKGPPIRLIADVSFEFALAIHELAVNAAKYGALSDPDGTVEVVWTLKDRAEGVWLTWAERGGPSVSPPSRSGLGSSIINDFTAHGAPAEIEFRPEGLVWRAHFGPTSFVSTSAD